MKHIKKSTMLTALLVISVTLTACGSNNNNNSTAPASSAPAAAASGENMDNNNIDYGLFCDETCATGLKLETPASTIKGKVGVIVNGLVFPYGAGEKKGAEEAQAAYFPGIELIVGDGNADPVVQTRVVDDFISKGIDVLVIDPVESDAMVPAIERAKKAGIKVIAMDRTINTDVITTIKASDVQEGYDIGNHLAGLMGNKGNVVELMGTPSASNTRDRAKGFSDAMKEHPDIKVVASQTANFSPVEGQSVMQDLLQRFPKGKLDAVYSHSDTMTIGAIQAIKAAGRTELIVVSIDGQKAAMDPIRNGAIAAIAVYPVPMPQGLIAAAKVLAGEELPKTIELSLPIITKENVDTYDGKTMQ